MADKKLWSGFVIMLYAIAVVAIGWVPFSHNYDDIIDYLNKTARTVTGGDLFKVRTAKDPAPRPGLGRLAVPEADRRAVRPSNKRYDGISESDKADLNNFFDEL